MLSSLMSGLSSPVKLVPESPEPDRSAPAAAENSMLSAHAAADVLAPVRIHPSMRASMRFKSSLTKDHLCKLAAATALVNDFETTSLTPYDAPLKVGSKSTAKIGGHATVSKYLKTHASTINVLPRARILTVGIVDLQKPADAAIETLAWDLDVLSDADRKALIAAAFDGKIVVGHNIGFDLFWAGTVLGRAPRPAAVIDSMLVARLRRPSIEIEALQQIENKTLKKILLASRKKTPGVSLNVLAVSLGLPELDKSYQKPVNWTPAVLSEGHYDYVGGDVSTPLQVVQRLLRMESSATISQIIDAVREINLQDVYSRATHRLVEMSINGMPWHADAAKQYAMKHAAEASKLTSELLVLAPEFLQYETQLRKIDASESNDLKAALDAYCAKHTSVHLPTSEGGGISTSAPDIALIPELQGLPLIQKYLALKGEKKLVSMSSEYSMLAEQDGRLHPLISLTTVTLRTASQTPNVQNMPRDPEFRALVAARPGHKILSIDYGQIELRIAAALASRSWNEILVAAPETHPKLNWKTLDWFGFKEARRLGLSDEPLPEALSKPGKGCEIDALKTFYFSRFAHLIRSVKERGLIMSGVFQAGLDPHLLTAIAKAARTGKIDTAGVPALDYLKSRSKDEQKDLKVTLKDERQSAKPNNFGLLYGMSADGLWSLGVSQYGLNWSKDEAAADREAWLELYPDIALWQLYVQLAQAKKHLAKMHVFAPFKKEWEIKENQKPWHVKTLAGRPLAAVVARDGMNYQDQGTGADMIMSALAEMPDEAARYAINIVHDELVFEIPDEHVDEVKKLAEETMIRCAARYLEPYNIPVEADGEVGDVWAKG